MNKQTNTIEKLKRTRRMYTKVFFGSGLLFGVNMWLWYDYFTSNTIIVNGDFFVNMVVLLVLVTILGNIFKNVTRNQILIDKLLKEHKSIENNKNVWRT